MKASIAIAAHNEGDLLWKTVASCVETTRGLGFEIVVADDASGDDSVALLRRHYPDVKVIVSPERRGVSATKDAAGRATSGEVIVFLDAHCKPEAGALERLVRDVEESEGRAVITPSVAALNVETWECATDQVGYGYALDLAWFGQRWVSPDELRVVNGPGGRTYLRQPALVGCCAALSRTLYETLGGFDTGMKSHGSEDVDFGLKTWLMGYSVWLDPEVLVGHRFRSGFSSYAVPPQHPLLNQMRMARKNFNDPAWESWRDRQSARYPREVWDLAWGEFEQSRASVERERDYLLKNRPHDETWYAREFGLEWPLSLDARGEFAAPPLAPTIIPPTVTPEPTKPPHKGATKPYGRALAGVGQD